MGGNMSNEILRILKDMEILIKTCPELFHDGINNELIEMINEIKKETKINAN